MPRVIDPEVAQIAIATDEAVISELIRSCYSARMKYVFLFVLAASSALAEPPVVEAVTASQSGSGWRFDVTLSHPDTGWDHYADGWRVETASGEILGTRVLAHPHQTEQPFTRSLSGVEIPQSITTVFVRSKCIVDGWSAEATEFTLN